MALTFVAGCDLFRSSSGPDGGALHSANFGDPCTVAASYVCRVGLTCDPTTSTCRGSHNGPVGATCDITDQCAAGLYCGARRQCDTAGTSPEGGDCSRTSDCAAGLVCSIEGFGGTCRPSGTADIGDACAAEIDCIAGLSCSAVDGQLRCINPPAPTGDAGPPQPFLPPWPGVQCQVDDGTPRAYFRVPRGTAADGDFYSLPFPNDVRLHARRPDLSGHPTPGTATTVDVLGRTIAAAQEDLDGWATNPVVYFRFSRGYDGSTIGDHVRWVDITPGSPDYGIPRGLGWITTYGSISRYICPDWVAFRQGHGAPLRPATTYAVILTSGLVTSGTPSAPFARDADFDAMMQPTMPAEAALQAAWNAYRPLRDYAASGAIDPTTVLTAAVFTTQSTERVVPRLRDVVQARPAPVLSDVTVCAAGTTSPCDDGTPQRRCGTPSASYTEIHARVTLPVFQQGTAPYETPADGGGLMFDGSGAPVVARDESVCMMMTIPVGAPPAGGWPVVIAAHGTGGSFTGPLSDGLAETWAAGATVPVRAATIAWDLPQHGARRGGSTRSPDRLVFNFANPRAARDVWFQGAADLLALVRLAGSFSMDAATSPTGEAISFDPAHVVVWAHSQGATHAALAAPWEPGISAVLFSGLGGDLTESLLTKTLPVDVASIVPYALLDVDGGGHLVVGDMNPALAIVQSYYEAVDPVNLARRMWLEPFGATDTGRHLFMTYGLADHFSTPETMGSFARAARLPLVGPQLEDIGLGAALTAPATGNVSVSGTMRTVGLRQYAAPTGSDGHFVSTTSVQGRADATRFVLEALTGVAPSIGP